MLSITVRIALQPVAADLSVGVLVGREVWVDSNPEVFRGQGGPQQAQVGAHVRVGLGVVRQQRAPQQRIHSSGQGLQRLCFLKHGVNLHVRMSIRAVDACVGLAAKFVGMADGCATAHTQLWVGLGMPAFPGTRQRPAC